MTKTTALEQSLTELATAAREAGLDPVAARDEGLRVAAALAESTPGAAGEWVEAAQPGTTDLRDANQAFFDAAVRGRRWRESPTALLLALVDARSPKAAAYAHALTGVAAAACTLGEPSITVTANAAAASAAYLSAVASPSRAPGSPSSFPPPPSPFLADEVLRQQRLLSDYLRGAEPRLEPAPPAAPPAASARGASAPGASAQAEAPEEQTVGPAAEPEKSVEELLAELDAMIGLDRVKKEVHRQVALLTVEKLREQAGLRAPKMSRHLVFVGNPGTGKTTVARLLGAIYKALGLLSQGQLIEVDRSELVAGYVGQTAIKTAEVCARAVGGVLFIDEAYGLTGDQYAQEAVNTLVKEMEDHREDLVLIVAGYPDPMAVFIASNPGLASRFTTTIEFDDYTDDELMAILTSIAESSDYELTEDAERHVRQVFQATPRTSAFGNGRFSRNLFEAAVGRHAWRLRDAKDPTRDELRLLTAADFTDEPDDAPTGDGPVPDDDAVWRSAESRPEPASRRGSSDDAPTGDAPTDDGPVPDEGPVPDQGADQDPVRGTPDGDRPSDPTGSERTTTTEDGA